MKPFKNKVPTLSLGGKGDTISYATCSFSGSSLALCCNISSSHRLEDSSAFKIYALEIDGKEPAEGSIIYYNKKDEVGSVTSAIWSPMAKKSIALAQLKLGSSKSKMENLWVEIYSLKELQYHKLMKKVSIVKPPFINLARRSACPPSNC